MGNRESARLVAARNLEKDPDFYKKLAKESWKNKTNRKTGGFTNNPELARIAGTKGGKISAIKSGEARRKRKAEHEAK